MFNEGRENLHDEARSGRPSLVNDDVVRKFKKGCVKTDVSQFLICLALSSDFKDSTL